MKRKLQESDCGRQWEAGRGSRLQLLYCNFTNFRCSFISVFSVVNGITEIEKTPK